jgi:hypothetical protein
MVAVPYSSTRVIPPTGGGLGAQDQDKAATPRRRTWTVVTEKLRLTGLAAPTDRVYIRPGCTGLYMWYTSPKIRDGIWSTPYICCNYS